MLSAKVRVVDSLSNSNSLGGINMVRMLVKVNISKGFKVWSEMAKSLEPEMNKVGAKMIWAGTNPDETEIYAVTEMQDPSQMKTLVSVPTLQNSVRKVAQMFHQRLLLHRLVITGSARKLFIETLSTGKS